MDRRLANYLRKKQDYYTTSLSSWVLASNTQTLRESPLCAQECVNKRVRNKKYIKNQDNTELKLKKAWYCASMHPFVKQ